MRAIPALLLNTSRRNIFTIMPIIGRNEYGLIDEFNSLKGIPYDDST